MLKNPLNFAKTLEEKMIQYRRDFHRYPESGWVEFRTTSRVAEVLLDLGYEVYLGKQIIDESQVMGRMEEENIKKHIKRSISQGAREDLLEKMEGYTGVMGILDTGKEGPTVACRFDIDANDGIESQDENHRPVRDGFASINHGAMHACGHDGHTAIGLALAEVLKRWENSLAGKIKLIFQPAEEGVRGAKAMVSKGILDDVDYFLASHLGFGLNTGFFCPNSAGFLSTTKIDAIYKGKGAHAGAAPQEGKNALLAAASAILNIHAIPPHGEGTTRVNVGRVEGGVGRNVVPPNALMKIETRGENSELNEYVLNRTINILENMAKMYDIDCEIKKVGEAVTVKGDDDLGKLIEEEAHKVMEIKEIVANKSLGGSEDATFMMKRVQQHGGRAAYMIVGSNIAAGHHNEKFDLDERAMNISLEIFTRVIFRLMNKIGEGDLG